MVYNIYCNGTSDLLIQNLEKPDLYCKQWEASIAGSFYTIFNLVTSTGR